jgi:hypothetical protein
MQGDSPAPTRPRPKPQRVLASNCSVRNCLSSATPDAPTGDACPVDAGRAADTSAPEAPAPTSANRPRPFARPFSPDLFFQPLPDTPSFFRDPPPLPPLFISLEGCAPARAQRPPAVPDAIAPPDSLQGERCDAVRPTSAPRVPLNGQRIGRRRLPPLHFSESQRSILDDFFDGRPSNPYANSQEVNLLREQTHLSVQQIRTYIANRRMRSRAAARRSARRNPPPSSPVSAPVA